MPNARTANAVRLEFAPDSLAQSNLSAAYGLKRNRAEAICDPAADRNEGEHHVFGDLLRHD